MTSLYTIFAYILVFVIFLISLSYAWFQYRFQYWSKKGVYGPPPKFLVGNIKELVDGSLHIGEQFEKLYMDTRSKPFVGIYLAHKVALLVNDLDLIKQILVKDFMHFTDHGLVHSEESEPLEGHLFNVNGNRWRNLRVRLLPSFTSGKMKIMFNTLVQYAKEMQLYLEPHVEAGDTVDLKELLSRYSTDIIGTCVFGVECKSISLDYSKFRVMSKKSQRLNFFRSAIQQMSLMAPWIVTRLKISMYQNDVNEFFIEAAKDIVKYRRDNKITGNDYMDTLVKLQDERVAQINDGKVIDCETEDDATMSIGDLAAQLFVFFVDGVETSSTTGSFALYELARHPEIQEKLRDEIDEVLRQHGGKLTFDALSDMKYLFQVVEETLRMYPPLPLLLRLCTRNYLIPGTNVTIEKGTSIMIPMLGIHRDPDIYPDPMNFNPDRFSAENKADRHKFAHLPFGEGPRMCMGTRFGALMTRMGLVTLLSHYTISVESKYVKPFKFVPNSFILAPIEGINLNLTKRDKTSIVNFY